MAHRQSNPNMSFAHPDDRSLIENAIEQSKKKPGEPVSFQARLYHLDGKYIWIEGVMTNQLANPDIKAMVFNYRDVSDRKNSEAEILKLKDVLEEKVIQRTEQLEALNKELESFTYSVSHDLRAPLRIIDGFSNILLEDLGNKIDASGKKNLDIIVKNARRMGMLIDDLLNFSKLGKVPMQISSVDMNSLVTEVLEEVALNSPLPENIIVETLRPVKGDSRLLKQVWINLISNAIKYSAKKEKPAIVIGSYKENNRAVYFVKDNGAGFDMLYVHKLFGVFQRLHKLEEFAGTGVGLALVQRIIVRHEGTVWAEGKLNEGATFYFSLPVRD
jgi:light-regulated signal transduction histidine kinase (bacteriophytochrome)